MIIKMIFNMSTSYFSQKISFHYFENNLMTNLTDLRAKV
jgi:hypothetical protein